MSKVQAWKQTVGPLRAIIKRTRQPSTDALPSNIKRDSRRRVLTAWDLTPKVRNASVPKVQTTAL